MTGFAKIVLVVGFALMNVSNDAAAYDGGNASLHFGLLHPSGVDVVGYTVEKQFSSDVYGFYTFGFPSIAAIGLNYYADYDANGLTSTIGIGVGSVLYGSVAYQVHVNDEQYLKIGAGYTTGIAYSGAYPVFSYESRF